MTAAPNSPAGGGSWPHDGLEDDLRPRMASVIAQRRPFALATICSADGGPRGPGAQMVVTEADCWGFVSGGCIEADVAHHARQTLGDDEPRRLVYGRGSPWVDTVLPCGGRLELLVERIDPADAAIDAFVAAFAGRQLVRYQSDGRVRRCAPPSRPTAGAWIVDHVFAPAQRLIVFGADPIALAIAGLGARLGWPSAIVWPAGPDEPPGQGIAYRRDTPSAALTDLAPDARTAIAVATHDLDYDESAILAALRSEAGYIGVLGARRRLPGRVQRLRLAGATDRDIARLHMPIGLDLGAATPWEIAVSVTAEIIAERQSPGSPA